LDLLKRLFSSFFRIFWTLTFDFLKCLFSLFFLVFWTLTYWNVFSHHFFGFFELWPSETSFLIIFEFF
jgi:hypothetical protein